MEQLMAKTGLVVKANATLKLMKRQSESSGNKILLGTESGPNTKEKELKKTI